MADRPILFSAPMVRALLDGRKTQTRRVLKPQPSAVCAGFQKVFTDPPHFEAIGANGKPCNAFAGKLSVHPYPPIRFGKGDRLWVRETWRDEHPIAIQKGRYSQEGRAGIPGPPGVAYRTIYRADGEPLQAWRRADGEHPYFTLDGPADDVAARHPSVCSTFDRTDGRGAFWWPSIHMPRWASRLTLTVTDVRVQRLQAISEADCIAEGIETVADNFGNGPAYRDYGLPDQADTAEWYRRPIDSFRSLWVKINGAPSWIASPWVVALTFIVERRNIDAGAGADR